MADNAARRPDLFRAIVREVVSWALLAVCFGAVLIAYFFENPRRWLRPALMVLATFALVFMVYRPMLPGIFLMDDHRLVVDDNPLLTGEFTWWNIWFQTDFVLSNLVFWAQWLAWGDHPGGYHAVNMVLHAVSAILLWRVLVRLQMPWAWAAALLFAVHPVAVTSVARIAELKNTLSLPFFLLSFWAWLRWEDRKEAGDHGDYPPSLPSDGGEGRGEEERPMPRASRPAPPAWSSSIFNFHPLLWYVLSLVCFVLALLSKTSPVMLPPVLLLCIWWRRGKITRRDIWRLTPFFLIALFFGVMSAWFQKYQALAGVSLPPQTFGERLALAGHIIWFYFGKVLLPLRLNAFYPIWKINATSFASFVPCLLVMAVFVLGWRFRQGWGRPVIFGFGCFVILLFPVLGFFDGQYLTWFQVSDHLQYLPMIAALSLAVAGLYQLLGANIFRIAAVILVAGCSILACHRAQIFSNEESLMRDCLAKNPAAWGAQDALGTILARRHDLPGAIENFKIALACQPDAPLVHLNLAHALALEGKFDEAEPHFLAALKQKPISPEIHRQYASALEHQGRNREALIQWRMTLGLKPEVQTRLGYAALLFKTGDYRQSENQLRLAIQANPDLPEALNNLAWQLATSADDHLRNGPEAVHYAERACALTGDKQPGLLGTLAAAYAEAGRFPEAIKTGQQAIALANRQGNAQFAAINTQLLGLYQMERPYHTPAGN